MKIETKAARRLKASIELAAAGMPTPLKERNSKRKRTIPKALFSNAEQIAASVGALASSDASQLNELIELAEAGCVGLEKVFAAFRNLSEVCAAFGRENGMPEDHEFVQSHLASARNVDQQLEAWKKAKGSK